MKLETALTLPTPTGKGPFKQARYAGRATNPQEVRDYFGWLEKEVLLVLGLNVLSSELRSQFSEGVTRGIGHLTRPRDLHGLLWAVTPRN